MGQPQPFLTISPASCAYYCLVIYKIALIASSIEIEQSFSLLNSMIKWYYAANFNYQMTNMVYLVRSFLFLFFILPAFFETSAQSSRELNKGWRCMPVDSVIQTGEQLSLPDFSLDHWMPARVPGTVLTNLLENHKVPDPFFGMNNEKIADIYQTGRRYYTYWFACDLYQELPKMEEHIWVQLRGVNYGFDVFLNGKKLNDKIHNGMFLRAWYDVSSHLRKDGKNRLAVLVYPVDPVGNPNGGQGGDGTIARNVSHQYVAGWDWIQPVRDRNTGIWDKVIIEKTGPVRIENPQVVTRVPGVRNNTTQQDPATVHISTNLKNLSGNVITGTVSFFMAGQTVKLLVTLKPYESKRFTLPILTLKNPKLWWPNTYGSPDLYAASIQFQLPGSHLSDQSKMDIGVREIQYVWNIVTRSREIRVNGQPIFIKGGNWIVSDEMLRLSKERYDAEIRFHRDMNLNLIRVWGGALLERPEFYEACDRNGILVMQDLWGSGDCNGRWMDPKKLDDQWTRRKYPDDHNLYLESVADQICMIRNHPSLAIWCGGNEITPPEDIYHSLKDSIMPALDNDRWFIDYSNSDSMSLNTLGGNGDGPYGIRPVNEFWEQRSFPFNSEIGSVGLGDYSSLERFLPPENWTAAEDGAQYKDSVWDYHKYIGYDHFLLPYGKPTDLPDFTRKAQLVNYDQYRALIEGFSAHAWEWYTGVIIWKTQNPWTAMRGQMYDYYLDPNACLYGLRKGSELIHVMYNPVDGMVTLVNNGFEGKRSLMLIVKTLNFEGKENLLTQVFTGVEAKSVKKIFSIKDVIDNASKQKGSFLYLQLIDDKRQPISDNLYWMPDSTGKYSGLNEMKSAEITVHARFLNRKQIEITLDNPANAPISFFNRISLTDPVTGKRILPSFFSDNYVSILPGTSKNIIAELPGKYAGLPPVLTIQPWNKANVTQVKLEQQANPN